MGRTKQACIVKYRILGNRATVALFFQLLSDPVALFPRVALFSRVAIFFQLHSDPVALFHISVDLIDSVSLLPCTSVRSSSLSSTSSGSSTFSVSSAFIFANSSLSSTRPASASPLKQ